MPFAVRTGPLNGRKRPLTFAAAHVKAHHSLAYADAFAIALAEEVDAVVVTGDPEFQQVEARIVVRWIAL